MDGTIDNTIEMIWRVRFAVVTEVEERAVAYTICDACGPGRKLYSFCQIDNIHVASINTDLYYLFLVDWGPSPIFRSVVLYLRT